MTKPLSEPAEPAAYQGMGRRELLRRWGPAVLVGAVLGGGGALLSGRRGRHRPPAAEPGSVPPDWRIDPGSGGRIAVASGMGPAANLGRCLAALGGIEQFINSGERVLLKPNCAWDRTPSQAANTDPELVAEMARLCRAAGAASVMVADNSCHDPQRALARSGIGPAALSVGARVGHQNTLGRVNFDLGPVLGTWQVLRPLAEVERVINMPVVKHHSLATATVGMKNWLGILVGPRATLHQRLPQATAELGRALRPTLTVVDATRILTGGGPTGGSLALVRPSDQVAVSTDPVAADAWGASLLDLEPFQLPHLSIGEGFGLGTPDWRSVAVEA